jgi:hypothetical protein
MYIGDRFQFYDFSATQHFRTTTFMTVDPDEPASSVIDAGRR